MIPLVVLLLGLAASSGQSDYERRWALNALRRRLGLWPLEDHPGSISKIFDRIHEEHGVPTAVAAHQLYRLLQSHPNHLTADPRHDAVGALSLEPFLYWFAARWARGEVSEEIRAALLHPDFEPPPEIDERGFKRTYGKKRAWSDLVLLFQWFSRTHPALTNTMTWEQARSDEYQDFKARLPSYDAGRAGVVPPGELIYRFALNSREDAPWTVERYTDPGEISSILKAMSSPSKSRWYTEPIDVLRMPDGEPMVVIELVREGSPPQRVVKPRRIYSSYQTEPLYWLSDGSSEMDQHIPMLYEYLTFTFQNPLRWPNPEGLIIAFYAIQDKEERKKLLDTYPALFEMQEESDSTGILSHHFREADYGFIERWAALANAYPYRFPKIPGEVAASQDPSHALLEWFETGEWRDDLIEKPVYASRELLPGIFRELTLGQDPDDDLTELGGTDHETTLPVEMKVWEIYAHPSGAELEVKFQGYIWYDWIGHQWRVSVDSEAQFRSDPKDPATWETSDDFDDFELFSLVSGTQWRGRALDRKKMESLGDRPWRVSDGTSSLDEAYKTAWEYLTEAIEDAEMDGDSWEKVFPKTLMIDPPEDVEITDVLEALDLLK